MSKNIYSSKDVVVIPGDSRVTPEVEALGYDQDAVNRISSYVETIVLGAKAEGLSPSECYNACLTALVYLLNHEVPPDTRFYLISATSEALCVAAGGGSDQGTIVLLTAMNVGQISGGHYLGAFVTGASISWVWWSNAHRAAHTSVRGAQHAYALGAACGTVTGMWIIRLIYGG
jgi:hypothetical protein